LIEAFFILPHFLIGNELLVSRLRIDAAADACGLLSVGPFTENKIAIFHLFS